MAQGGRLERRETSSSLYTANARSMMQTVYEVELWTMLKPENAGAPFSRLLAHVGSGDTGSGGVDDVQEIGGAAAVSLQITEGATASSRPPARYVGGEYWDEGSSGGAAAPAASARGGGSSNEEEAGALVAAQLAEDAEMKEKEGGGSAKQQRREL